MSSFLSVALVDVSLLSKNMQKHKYSEKLEKSNSFKNSQNELKKALTSFLFEIIVT